LLVARVDLQAVDAQVLTFLEILNRTSFNLYTSSMSTVMVWRKVHRIFKMLCCLKTILGLGCNIVLDLFYFYSTFYKKQRK